MLGRRRGYARRYLPAHAEPAGLLPDLIITTSATAMTGDEYAVTGELMNEHVLPLLRRHRVRFMQIARAGQPDAAGHVVLVDSRAPARTHLRGPWALSDELAATGTVPQLAARRRICSYRANPVPG